MNPKLNKEELKSYLLGTLPSTGQSEVEECLLSDPELYRELNIAEDELIDQYVDGELSDVERQQFESHFLVTTERQQQLRFGKIFRRYLNSHRDSTDDFLTDPPETNSDTIVRPDSSSSFLGWLKRQVVPVLVVILFMALAGVALYVIGVRRHQKNESRQTMILKLSPAATKSGSTVHRLSSPPSDTNIKLQLEVVPGKFRNYKAELLSQDATVSSDQEITTETCDGQSIVPFVVPGEVLKPGDYEVKLSGTSESGEVEDVDNYSFRVVGP